MSRTLPVGGKLDHRVCRAAQDALAAHGLVTAIDVLVRIGWLTSAQVEDWRRGRVPYLERVATASLGKLGTTLRLLSRWANRAGLGPRETVYLSWTRDRHPLRFSKTGDRGVERAYSTHWVSPKLSEAAQTRRSRGERASPAAGSLPPGVGQRAQDHGSS